MGGGGGGGGGARVQKSHDTVYTYIYLFCVLKFFQVFRGNTISSTKNIVHFSLNSAILNYECNSLNGSEMSERDINTRLYSVSNQLR